MVQTYTSDAAVYYRQRYQNMNGQGQYSRQYGNGGNGQVYDGQQQYSGRSAGRSYGGAKRERTPLSDYVYRLEKGGEQSAARVQDILSKVYCTVTDIDGFPALRTPYNPDFSQRCKEMGGRYVKMCRCWFFAPEKRQEVCDAVSSYFPDGGRRSSGGQRQYSQGGSRWQGQNSRQGYQYQQGGQQYRGNTQYQQPRPQPYQQAQPQGSVSVPSSCPVLSLSAMEQAGRNIDPGIPTAMMEVEDTVFCRAPLDSPFTAEAERCHGIWIADLCLWALSARLKAQFVPVFNSVSAALCHNGNRQ